MRRIQLSVGLAVAMSLAAFTGAQAQTWCAVGTSVHNHARIVLHHKTLAKCDAGANGCKCVSCYNLDKSVSSMCFALVAPMPK
jgi:hypothetical protein